VPARPQLVVVVDTDAPVVGQLASSPGVSEDASVDTLRVDVLDEQDHVTETKSFLLPDTSDWPASFGVEPGNGPDIRLRVRVFRGLLAAAGFTQGVATLDPPPTATIERIVHVSAPSSGVTTIELFLTEDCLGTPSSFAAPQTTCIDGRELAGPPTDGVVALGSVMPPTRVGTWKKAFEVRCSAKAPASSMAVCIPGGFSILGSTVLAGSSDQFGFDPVPLRPVVVSPFYLDTTEYTVRRFRSLLAKHQYHGTMPALAGMNPFCTWLGTADTSLDDYPLNCVTWTAAAEICQLEGGTLPSEAEWEHAARGRGRSLDYPWGNEDPTCCAATLARQSTPGLYFACKGEALQPVGSHVDRAACAGLADISRDGVIDLEGSVVEAVFDDLQPFDAPCWSKPGIPVDPLCLVTSSPGHAARGNGWASYLLTPLPTRYLSEDATDTMGFRCRYQGGP
jgi:hypothetical protein